MHGHGEGVKDVLHGQQVMPPLLAFLYCVSKDLLDCIAEHHKECSSRPGNQPDYSCSIVHRSGNPASRALVRTCHTLVSATSRT